MGKYVNDLPRDFNRHDLLFLTQSGWQTAWSRRERPEKMDEKMRACYPFIPAIYCAQTGGAQTDMIRVGISYPERVKGVRHRISTWIPSKEVLNQISPWEAVKDCERLRGAIGELMYALKEFATRQNLSFGIFGSAALQAVTGFSYLDDDSDLDVLVGGGNEETLYSYLSNVELAEAQLRVRADIEVAVGKGCFVKLRELLAGQSTVLVKSNQGPYIASCYEIWNIMKEQALDKRLS